MKVASRSTWTAPSVERAVAASAARARRGLQTATSGWSRERRQRRRDLPIWESTPGVVRFDADGWGPVQRDDVPDVPGAFVLSNILTSSECEQLLGLSTAMGWTEDAPVSLGRQIRQNENCVWIADDSLWEPIWARLAPHMPVDPERGAPVGLNQRWRLYRYDGANEDVFRMHTDGDWPGSAVVDGKLVRDAFGDRWSQLTLLLYLDDDYDGGETTSSSARRGRAQRRPAQRPRRRRRARLLARRAPAVAAARGLAGDARRQDHRPQRRALHGAGRDLSRLRGHSAVSRSRM